MILVILDSGLVSKASLCAISAGLKLKAQNSSSSVVGLLMGAGDLSGVAGEYAGYGLDKVLTASSDSFKNYLAVPYAECVANLDKEHNFKFIVSANTTYGRDLLPRISGLLDIAQASDVLAILDDGSFRRPMYAGNIIADVELKGEKKAVTIRQTAFDPAQKGDSAAEVAAVDVGSLNSEQQTFVSFDTEESERPELTDAEVVISGGRALKSKENFDKYIMPLADKLGAAIGASRAAVDSGYAPNDWQVGQTGKVVAPKLYIAIGISGAIQHLAGMKDSKVIVAINKDAEAPIFEIADYGLVADLYDVVPELIEAL